MVEKETVARYETGYVKLMKMTKGYNWEIKVFEDMNDATFKEIIKKIEEYNTLMNDKFGEMFV